MAIVRNDVCSVGGESTVDEFVIIIPPESYGNVSDIIEKIKAIFAKPWFLKGADYYCTIYCDWPR